MTCKDCIHYSVCKLILDSFSLEKLDREGAENCRCYKDRSKIIELPCKVGDKVYVLRSATSNNENFYMFEDRVKRVVSEKSADVDSVYTRIEFFNHTSCFHWYFKNIYTDKKEAEQKLIELNSKQ